MTNAKRSHLPSDQAQAEGGRGSSGAASVERPSARAVRGKSARAAPVFLTMKQVAEQVQVAQRTVARWIKSSELRSHKLGPRKVRISQEDLDAFIAASRR